MYAYVYCVHVWMRVCVCECICIFVLWVCVCVYVRVYGMHICVSVCVCMYVCMCACALLPGNVFGGMLCMCKCMHEYAYCTHTHTHTHTHRVLRLHRTTQHTSGKQCGDFSYANFVSIPSCLSLTRLRSRRVPHTAHVCMKYVFTVLPRPWAG